MPSSSSPFKKVMFNLDLRDKILSFQQGCAFKNIADLWTLCNYFSENDIIRILDEKRLSDFDDDVADCWRVALSVLVRLGKTKVLRHLHNTPRYKPHLKIKPRVAYVWPHLADVYDDHHSVKKLLHVA